MRTVFALYTLSVLLSCQPTPRTNSDEPIARVDSVRLDSTHREAVIQALSTMIGDLPAGVTFEGTLIRQDTPQPQVYREFIQCSDSLLVLYNSSPLHHDEFLRLKTNDLNISGSYQIDSITGQKVVQYETVKFADGKSD